jgi:hypothetical protein
MARSPSVAPARAAAVRAQIAAQHSRIRAVANLMANAITREDYAAAEAQLDPACAHMAALQAMARLAGISFP